MEHSGAHMTYLELVLQQLFLVRELAIEAEEPSFIGRQFLEPYWLDIGDGQAGGARGAPMTYADVHLVFLMWVHGGGGRKVCTARGVGSAGCKASTVE